MINTKPDTDKLVGLLQPHLEETLSLVEYIDGPIADVFTIGVFVSAIASLKLLSLQNDNPEDIADEFNLKWLNHVALLCQNNGNRLSRKELISQLQNQQPAYGNRFLQAIDPKNSEEITHNHAVQLTWELFSNASGKKAPEDFLKLVLVSGKILNVGLKIFSEIKE